MKENIQQLLDKYSRNACSEDEIRILEAWYLKIGEHNQGSMPSDESVARMLAHINESPKFDHKLASKSFPSRSHKRLFYIISNAAMLLLGIGLSVYWNKHSHRTESYTMQNDIAPGGNKAFLTLANGTKIALNESTIGTIAKQQDIDIIKNADGTIIYKIRPLSTKMENTEGYNTIETPRGGQYQVILSDGSKIWLNAESSLTFPVRFSSAERHVRITGEAYFEITHQYEVQYKNKRISFIVETNKQEIEVLGTQFNVNSYSNERTQQTTLVEGSVSITHKSNGEHIILKPGQQAQTAQHIHIVQADIERETAWKHGDFIYKKEKLSHILRQVARWYDVDIDCPEELSELVFSGMVSRKRPLSSIIAMIESTGSVKATLKERRIIISR